jgi:hypothetical protein
MPFLHPATAMYMTPDAFTIDNTPSEMHTSSASVQVTYDFQPSILGKRRRGGFDKAADLSP